MPDKPQIAKTKHRSLVETAKMKTVEAMSTRDRLESFILSLPDIAPVTRTDWQAVALELLALTRSLRKDQEIADRELAEALELINNAP